MKIYYLIFLICVVLTILLLLQKQKPQLGPKVYLPRYDGTVRNDDSIFVSVASYRDADCSGTLRELFRQADRPDKIFVGIVQQNKTHDVDCALAEKFRNVRMVRLNYNQARGPCYARYLASCLYRGETFFFQVDSHTQFELGWDTALIRMMRDLPANAVISHYPASWDDRGKQEVPFFNSARRHQRYFTYTSMFGEQVEQPRKHLATAGGMLFMRGNTVQQVPYDAELDWVFEGEEFLYSARLHTFGYDFYAPSRNVVYHYYNRADSPKFWDDLKFFRNRTDPTSVVHARMDAPPEGYFGTVRSLGSYVQLLEKNTL